ncbi:Uncharacterized protein APZ42_016783 [Daphnia magna]|uniref:Uncharacterized protein n=1 Tax=Daphnia magna TaxID=35525 RepID=A0A165A4J4_9CRUS|nr:Uncharacterized protein APZ42_016783 [Daphnia magna]
MYPNVNICQCQKALRAAASPLVEKRVRVLGDYTLVSPPTTAVSIHKHLHQIRPRVNNLILPTGVCLNTGWFEDGKENA